MILTLMAAVMLLGPNGAPDLQVAGSTAPTVRVIRSSHQVDFPNRFVLTVHAETESRIGGAKLFYTVGDAPIQIFAYPTRLSTEDGVVASFEIETGQRGFIPQGVNVEYYYVFTDDQGHESRSASFTFEYLDDRYRWERLVEDDYTLLWHDRPRAQVERAAADVSSRLARVRRLFGNTDDYDFKVVLVNSRRESRSSFPSVSQTAQDVSLYGGFAFSDYGAIVLGGLSTDALIHELAHLMLDRAMDSPRARVPAWLNEGLAMSFERDAHYRDSDVQIAHKSGSLLKLRHMRTVPGKPDDVRLFYAQSAGIVRYLLDEFGDESMSALLASMNEGTDIEEALKDVYGHDVEGLDRAWRSHLSGDRSIGDFADPGTLGTAALIGGAVAVTASVVGVRWLKRALRSEPGA